MLFVRFQYQLEVVGISHINWTPNISTGLPWPHLGLCMWVRAMETYDRVAKVGMGDGFIRKWLFFWESPSSTYLEGIKQAANVW